MALYPFSKAVGREEKEKRRAGMAANASKFLPDETTDNHRLLIDPTNVCNL
ncbi:hypothetical protein FP2506_15759 [Fulvimarina pelagi HTCC2506]|uniref:Uncharacterized protein n=1 Tax=Fulvimarina pelagi HTCC2506 TaxID=314231 RepID=Q0G3C8_9HYPH|nr:hypothetical protein FP2506_15759 [Fulvimarina pelagi HTCC2506]